MWQTLKRMKWSAIVAALVYIALGVVLLVWPDAASAALCTLLGVGALCYGLFQIISFFTREDTESWGWGAVDLVIGVVALAFGVFALAQPHVVMSILPVVLGCAVIVNSCVSLKRALELRSLNAEKWWVALLLSLVTIVFGGVMLFNPFGSHILLLRIIGGVLIYEGIADIVTVYHVSKRLRNCGVVDGTVVKEQDL